VVGRSAIFRCRPQIIGAVLLEGTIAVLSDKQVSLEVSLFDLQTGSKKQSIPIQPMPIQQGLPLVASADGKKLLLADSEAGEQILAASPRSDGSLPIASVKYFLEHISLLLLPSECLTSTPAR
jgi:hypothetical protein